MSFAHTVVTVVILGTCLLGGFVLLLRVALERGRLVSRYDHIKAVMAYEEKLKAHQKKMQSAVAQEADFVAEPVEESEQLAADAMADADGEPEAVAEAEPMAVAEPAG